MRFTGAVCPKPGTAQAAGGPAAGVDDGAGIELTAEGRQDVFNLRADIIADRNKLAGLQAYIHGLEARGIIGSSTIAVADPPPSSTLVLH